MFECCSFENNPKLEGPQLLGLASYDTNCSWMINSWFLIDMYLKIQIVLPLTQQCSWIGEVRPLYIYIKYTILLECICNCIVMLFAKCSKQEFYRCNTSESFSVVDAVIWFYWHNSHLYLFFFIDFINFLSTFHIKLLKDLTMILLYSGF